MAMMGYHEALTNSRRSIAVLALILGFTSVLFLIVDLDRPRKGMLQVSQQAMIDLRNSMK
jgi:formate-dependent nitrite reductase membrane component NrfD